MFFGLLTIGAINQMAESSLKGPKFKNNYDSLNNNPTLLSLLLDS